MNWGSRKFLHKKPDLGNCREIVYQGYQPITMIYDLKKNIYVACEQKSCNRSEITHHNIFSIAKRKFLK